MASHVAVSVDEALAQGRSNRRIFNPEDPKHRCCFRCCHIRIGFVFICGIEAVATMLAAITAMASHLAMKERAAKGIANDLSVQSNGYGPGITVLENASFLSVSAGISVFLLVITYIAIGLAWYGMLKDRHVLISPFLAAMIGVGVSLLVLVPILAWSTASTFGQHPAPVVRKVKKGDADSLVMSLMAGGCGLVLQAYFIYVIYQFYRFVQRSATYARVADFVIAFNSSA